MFFLRFCRNILFEDPLKDQAVQICGDRRKQDDQERIIPGGCHQKAIDNQKQNALTNVAEAHKQRSFDCLGESAVKFR